MESTAHKVKLNLEGTGVGSDAGDLLRIYLAFRPADNPSEFAKLVVRSLFLRYAACSRITVPMVEKHIGDIESMLVAQEETS